MHGLSLIKKVIRLEPVERIPWVPFVGVHGAYLIGVDADQFLLCCNPNSLSIIF